MEAVDLPIKMKEGWRKDDEIVAYATDMNQMRWNILRQIEDIILRIFPAEYHSKYRCEVLQVASILEKTMHRLAPSYQAYCDVKTLVLRFKSLTIAHAVKVVRKDANLKKYMAFFKSKNVVRRTKLPVGAGAA